jgi:Tol biopolymer transport system component
VNFRPTWSADGRQIAFISDRGPNYDVLVKPADQGAQETLLFGRASEKPVWEVDFPKRGPWILFRVEDRRSDICAIRPGVDSVAIPLVVTGAVERMPTLSPDGRGFAYVSYTTGRPEVYKRPFPEVNSAVWQVSTAGASEPRWAHSGRELLFHTEARELASVPVTAGDALPGGSRNGSFPLRTIGVPTLVACGT